MTEIVIRSIEKSEICAARELAASYVDFHARYVKERLPTFFDIARVLDSDAEYANRQRLMVGAFLGEQVIGSACIERQIALTAPELSDDHEFWQQFNEHDLNVYCTLLDSLRKTYIGAPPDSLTVHSLAVQPAYRQRGIARLLLEYAIGELSPKERKFLYIEFARLKWLCQFGASLGFQTVRRTFSI